MKYLAKFFFSCLAVLLFSINLYAQPGTGTDDEMDVPIDGGVSLLMAAGIGYGAKKMKDAYQAAKQKNDLNC